MDLVAAVAEPRPSSRCSAPTSPSSHCRVPALLRSTRGRELHLLPPPAAVHTAPAASARIARVRPLTLAGTTGGGEDRVGAEAARGRCGERVLPTGRCASGSEEAEWRGGG